MMNYRLIIVFTATLFYYNISAQNIGIGTNTPQQVLDVNGKLKISNDTAAPVAGTIRYNQATSDFEGYNGTEWKSLTASASSAPYINSSELRERKGAAIAIHGDIAVIGAPWFISSSASGYVYVFQKINNVWVQIQVLSQQQGSFGECVALYNDYLVVGSPFFVSSTSRGKISLYKKINNQFVFLTQYHPGVFSPSTEYFACSLSIHGSIIAVGCISKQRGYLSATNRVYVLSIVNDGLQLEQEVFNPNIPAQEDFVISLAIDNTNLIIGAPGATSSGNTARGKVYVYTYAGANTYTYTNTLEFTTHGGDNDYFGEDLALSGNTLVIGCPGFDIDPLFNIGAFFICTKNTDGLFLSTSLIIHTHPFDTPETFMGKSIAIDNNIVIVGSNNAVYQYANNNNTWQFHKTLSASLPGISSFDAVEIAVDKQNYGLGSPIFNNNYGRVVLGDIRY
jgi:hypothetical protein